MQLVLADQRDIDPLKALYRVIVEEGNSFPHDRFPDDDDFMDYWFRGKSTVAACVPDRERAAGLPGRDHHVSVAGRRLAAEFRLTPQSKGDNFFNLATLTN